MATSAPPRLRIGLTMPPKPPLGTLRQALLLARAMRLDSFMVWDHLEDFFPRALWTPETTWLAKRGESSHQFFDYQTVLGALAASAGRVRLGVAVTEPIRRHPVVIAQAMLTVAHLTRRAPILGLGAGERANIEPFGLSMEGAVGRLDEALQVIRLCFDHGGEGPLSFAGSFYRLDRAQFDLQAPPGRKPRIWLGAHGPRMLRLTGQYADGWYPTGSLKPAPFAAKLEVIREAARAAGRDPDRIMPAFQVTVVAASTERKALALVNQPVVRYLTLLLPASDWAEFGHEHPFGAAYRGYVDYLPEQHSEAELQAALAATLALDPDAIGFIWGTPDRIVAALGDYIDAGVRYIVPQLPALAVSRRDALYQIKTLNTIRRAFR